MKRLIITLFFISCAVSLFAQDKIMKKSGVAIMCKITDVNTDMISYKLWGDKTGIITRINKKDVFMILYEDGLSMLISPIEGKTTPSVNNTNLPAINAKKTKDTIIYVAHSSGLNIKGGHYWGIGRVYGDDFFRLSTVYEYFLSKRTSFGLGVGVNIIENFSSYPLFLELKNYFTPNAGSAYLYYDLGAIYYNVPNKDNFNLLFELGIGKDFKFSNNNLFFVSAGCLFERFAVNNSIYKDYNVNIAIDLCIGFKF